MTPLSPVALVHWEHTVMLGRLTAQIVFLDTTVALLWVCRLFRAPLVPTVAWVRVDVRHVRPAPIAMNRPNHVIPAKAGRIAHFLTHPLFARRARIAFRVCSIVPRALVVHTVR